MLKLKVLDHSLCLLQVYQTFVDEVNELFYEYQLLNLQPLWGILTHMLEQTQIRGKV